MRFTDFPPQHRASAFLAAVLLTVPATPWLVPAPVAATVLTACAQT